MLNQAWLESIMGRVFANGPGDWGSISRSSHTKDSKCGTIASQHLVGRWSRDYYMCRQVFLCFFPLSRCFKIRGKRRWMWSSRWRLEFVLERRKVAKQIKKNDEKAFVINSNKRLFTQLYSFTTPSWPLVSWLPHVSTGLSLFSFLGS